MYLTQITVSNVDLRQHHISDNYRWKQEINKSISCPRFRVYEGEENTTVLVFSPEIPQKLPWGDWEVKQIPEHYYDHKKYVFSLRANPTIRKYKGKEIKGSRYPTKDIQDWINRKAERHGFQILNLNINPLGYQISYKGRTPIPHYAVDFDGVLEVTDSAKFKTAALGGVGSAKVFGFGLLLLKIIN
jgi:CRISPR system Cascade subunit CasE